MRPTTSTASAPAALLALAALVASGCGLKEVDHAQIEREIRADIAKRAGVQANVSCPKHRSADKGTTFTCTVSQPGGLRTEVTVRMGDGGKFSYGAPR